MRIQIRNGSSFRTMDALNIEQATGILANTMHASNTLSFRKAYFIEHLDSDLCSTVELVIEDTHFPGPSKTIVWNHANGRYLEAMELCRKHIEYCLDTYEAFYT